MSWWDYGYQIAGMANRTTLVDNNTWNNSHIALVTSFCFVFAKVFRLSCVVPGWQGYVKQRNGGHKNHARAGRRLRIGHIWRFHWIFWRRYQQIPLDGSYCRRRTSERHPGKSLAVTGGTGFFL